MIKGNPFNPSKLSDLALWLKADSGITMSDIPENPINSPMDLYDCALWLDAAQGTTVIETGTACSSPLDISNCALWLDAGQGVTTVPISTWVTSTSYLVGDLVTLDGLYYFCMVTHTSGTFATDYETNDRWARCLNTTSLVSSWADQSGNGRDCIQSTQLYRPYYTTNAINGKPIIGFDGVNDRLVGVVTGMNGLTGVTVFVVMKRPRETSDEYLLSFENKVLELNVYSYNGLYTRFNTNAGYEYPVQYAYVPDMSENIILCTWYDGTGISNEGRSKLYYYSIFHKTTSSGTVPASLGNTTGYQLSGMYGTNTNPIQASIAEIIMYSRALTDSERKSVDLYLGSKYNLGVSSGKLTSWADQSGNDKNFVQPTDVSRPSFINNAIGTRPAIRFTPSEFYGSLNCLDCSVGTKPNARYYHTSVVFNNYMYIFGGYDIYSNVKQDTHKLNLVLKSNGLTAQAWSGELTITGTKPNVRDSHTAVVYGNYMYVFGGRGSSRFQDTHRLDLTTLEWSGELTTTGTKPAIRDSHTAVVYGNYMYIFGGYEGSYKQDTHRLDLTTLEWSGELTTTGTKPTIRDSHTAVVYGNYMYVFGGYTTGPRQDTHRLDLTTLEWSGELTTTGTKPTERWSHVAVVYGNYMYVFGGYGSSFYQDIHRLNLDTLEWSGELTTTGTKPTARRDSTAVVYGNYMYVFGGYDNNCKQDINCLDLTTLEWSGDLGGLNFLQNVPGATIAAVWKESRIGYYYGMRYSPVIRVYDFVGTTTRVALGANIYSYNSFLYDVGGRRLDADSLVYISGYSSNSTQTRGYVSQIGILDYTYGDAFLYLNGTLVGSNYSFQTEGNTQDISSNLIRIGGANPGEIHFSGEIAEIVVYPRTLSPTEINQLNYYFALKYPVGHGRVSSWADQSGNARDAVQAIEDYQPVLVRNQVNNKHGVLFTESHQIMGATGLTGLDNLTGCTLFLVYRKGDLGSSSGQIVSGFTSSNSNMSWGFSWERLYLQVVGGARRITNTYVEKYRYFDRCCVASMVFNGSLTGDSNRLKAYLDGLLLNLYNYDTIPAILSSWSTYSLHGGCMNNNTVDNLMYLHEIILYKSVLSDTDRHMVEHHLGSKYNVVIA